MKSNYLHCAHTVIVCLLLMCLCMAGYSQSAAKEDSTLPRDAKQTDATRFIAANKGKIQVLLLGMPGCPGTERATPLLTAYAKENPQGVTVVRCDVPPPRRTITNEAGLDPELAYIIDVDSKVAGMLGFFFYPTLYLLDKDATVRYSGKADMDAVKKMIMEIRSEDPAKKKKMYTPPLPKVGSTIKDFTIPSLKHQMLTLKQSTNDTITFILFSNTTCPYSRKAVQSLPDLLKQFKEKKLSTLIINFGQSKDEVADFYDKNATDRVVMLDPKAAICHDAFTVSVAPFFFILDKDLKVLARKPFTLNQARSDIGKALGINIPCGTTYGAG